MSEKTENNYNNIVVEIQNRIQFIIMVAIFFSGLLYNFFNIYNKTESDKIILSYGGLVGLYIIVYLLFEILKNEIMDNWLKRINTLTLIGVGVFLIPIIFLSLTAAKSPNLLILSILSILFKLSLYGVLIVPGLLIGFILFSPRSK